MVCYHPIEGYRAPGGQVVFAKRHGFVDLPVTVPCGQCSGCRLERSRQWALRIMHEASLYEDNAFLTLTYRDEDLPPDDSLRLEDVQRFMKRLRKRSGKLRFYMCGEYGETTHRPHYHMITFGYRPGDLKLLKKTESGHNLFTSEFLDEVWSHGDCYVGEVTFESAAYCGRYVMKKLTGSRKSEYGSRVPEFSTMSRRPGIAAAWLTKWKGDVFPNDYCVINGKQVRVPAFYDRMVEEDIGYWIEDDTGWPRFVYNSRRTESEVRRGNRKRNAAKHSYDNSPERLAVREEIHQRRIERLARS